MVFAIFLHPYNEALWSGQVLQEVLPMPMMAEGRAASRARTYLPKSR